MDSTIYLSVDECPTHKFQAISLNEKSASGGSGTRLTQAKCCGRWIEKTRFPLRPEDLRTIAREFDAAADLLEDAARDMPLPDPPIPAHSGDEEQG